MTARFRLILPGVEALAVAACCFLLIQACRLYAEWRLGAPLPGNASVLRIGEMYLRCVALAYGVFRVSSLHPFYRPGYRAWLERTPWTSRQPLPLGPVALAWEDVFVLAVLLLLALTVPGVDPWRVLSVYFMAYLGTLAVTFWPTGEPAHGYLVAFGIGLVLRLYPHPAWMVVAALAVYGIAVAGLRRALRRFPWDLDWQRTSWARRLDETGANRPDQACGWPYDRLGPPRRSTRGLDRWNALLVSMLVGWWLFALAAALEPAIWQMIVGGALLEGTWTLGLVRLGVYTTGYTSPMNLWGRLFSGRWIIPGYDRVFVGPLCTVLVPAATAWVLYSVGASMDVALPVCCGLMLFAAIATPPSLRRWQLTGRHRIVPGITNRKEFIQVG
jgi:hypothetical protein